MCSNGFGRFLVALVGIAFALSLMPVQAQEKKSPIASLQPFVDNQTLAGAVTLVADKNKVLSQEAIGYADIGASRPMLVEMIFWIASMSKPITAVGLMMLVDEGKVSLDDPVAKFIPEFKNVWVISKKDKENLILKRPKRPITVRDVMNHTSGLPFSTTLENPTIDMVSLRDATRSYALTPLLTEPGENFLYSNAGINTGGRIIEVVSGMPFETFMVKRLFGPLGMKDTTFWPNEAQLKRLAKTYTPGKDKKRLVEMPIKPLQYPLSDRGRHPCPAGGYFSTASDCGRFCRMLLAGGEWEGNRYLSEKAIAEMTKRQTAEGVKANWGVGWSLGDGSYNHGGAYATNMTVDTKRGLVTVFMVQHSGFPGNGNQSQGVWRKAAYEMFSK
jgi:CubicO group peptidase (beta-lactamase class C family)